MRTASRHAAVGQSRCNSFCVARSWWHLRRRRCREMAVWSARAPRRNAARNLSSHRGRPAAGPIPEPPRAARNPPQIDVSAVLRNRRCTPLTPHRKRRYRGVGRPTPPSRNTPVSTPIGTHPESGGWPRRAWTTSISSIQPQSRAVPAGVARGGCSCAGRLRRATTRFRASRATRAVDAATAAPRRASRPSVNRFRPPAQAFQGFSPGWVSPPHDRIDPPRCPRGGRIRVRRMGSRRRRPRAAPPENQNRKPATVSEDVGRGTTSSGERADRPSTAASGLQLSVSRPE